MAKKEYDWLVVGAGLSGATFAHEMLKAGKKVLVVDKREHIGGLCHTPLDKNTLIHWYGTHVFNTNDRALWDYVQVITPFRPYFLHTMASHAGRMLPLPATMRTVQAWSHYTGDAMIKEAAEAFLDPKAGMNCANAEVAGKQRMGPDLYKLLIRDYTKKMWGVSPRELPGALLQRVPVRLSWNDDYHEVRYSGLPEDGYTDLVERMLKGAKVVLKCDYLGTAMRKRCDACADRVYYTGPVDALFKYKYGRLPWRALHFEHKRCGVPDYQSCPVVHHTAAKPEYTRTTESRHFMAKMDCAESDLIVYEYPCMGATPDAEASYPVPGEQGEAMAAVYAHKLAAGDQRIVAGGRLGCHKYLNMDQAIGAAIRDADICRSDF